MTTLSWSVTICVLFLCYDWCLGYDTADNVHYFNDSLFRMFENDIAQVEGAGKLDILLHRIGTLAVYFRIYKRLVPTAASVGYLHQYATNVDFHDELAEKCVLGIEDCISYLEASIYSTQTWLRPDHEADEMPLTSEMFKRVISDNLLSLELSASQIFCYLTMKRLYALERLPFCQYDIVGTGEQVGVWPGRLMAKSPAFLDEFIGEPFECAEKSFCPDPCCLDLDSNSAEFTHKECRANICSNPERCSILPEFNDDLVGMRGNNWNISCPCPDGQMYRSDAGTCVHDNICGRKNVCREDEVCKTVYSAPGYRCACQLGYVRKGSGVCAPYGQTNEQWHGPSIETSSSDSITTLKTIISYSLFIMVIK